MAFDERMFSLISRDLYRDELSFIRELIQNSIDAGATEITIDIYNYKIVISDNGHGMSYEFLANDFNKIGKPFKTSDNQLGCYGLGRLSMWLIASNIVIESLDAVLEWNSIPEYTLIKSDKYTYGTKISIYYKLDKKLWYDDVASYIEKNIIIPKNVTIFLAKNGTIISKASDRTNRYSFNVRIDKAEVYLSADTKNTKYISIYEKGLFVTELYSRINCIINYFKHIKTLSRESTVLSDSEILHDIALAFKELANTDSSKLEQMNEQLAYLVYTIDDLELLKYVCHNNKPLSYWKENGYYYTDNIGLYERAKSKMVKAIYVDDYYIKGCCKIIGIPNLEELKDMLKRSFSLKEYNSEAKESLEYCSKFVESLANEITKHNEGIKASSCDIEYINNIIKNAKKELVTYDENNTDSSNIILCKYGMVSLGECSDANVFAWYDYSTDTIALNTNNDFIAKVLAKKRYELLEEVLTHELVHKLGYYSHDNSFVSTYNYLRALVLSSKLDD